MENVLKAALQLHQTKHFRTVGTEYLVVDSVGMGSPPSPARLVALQEAVLSLAGAGDEHPQGMKSLFQGWKTPWTNRKNTSWAGPRQSSALFIRPRAVEGPQHLPPGCSEPNSSVHLSPSRGQWCGP